MLDNLLFHNIEESDKEDCTDIIFKLLEEKLEMPDARREIKIDRAHRVGRKRDDRRKPRAIVAKFNFFLTWGNTYPTRLQKLLNVQKKFIRLITFKSYLEHTEPLFHKLKILNIFKINNYLSCLFMYRIKYFQNLPEFFNNYFTRNNEIHRYNTRNANRFHVNYGRTNYAKHTVINKGLKYGIPLMKRLAILGLILLLK
jgi:hypothetical protein